MLFLINTMMISGLCIVFDCYHDDYRDLCCFFLITMMISELCVLLDCSDDDYRAQCFFYCYDDD